MPLRTGPATTEFGRPLPDMSQYLQNTYDSGFNFSGLPELTSTGWAQDGNNPWFTNGTGFFTPFIHGTNTGGGPNAAGTNGRWTETGWEATPEQYFGSWQTYGEGGHNAPLYGRDNSQLMRFAGSLPGVQGGAGFGSYSTTRPTAFLNEWAPSTSFGSDILTNLLGGGNAAAGQNHLTGAFGEPVGAATPLLAFLGAGAAGGAGASGGAEAMGAVGSGTEGLAGYTGASGGANAGWLNSGGGNWFSDLFGGSGSDVLGGADVLEGGFGTDALGGGMPDWNTIPGTTGGGGNTGTFGQWDPSSLTEYGVPTVGGGSGGGSASTGSGANSPLNTWLMENVGINASQAGSLASSLLGLMGSSAQTQALQGLSAQQQQQVQRFLNMGAPYRAEALNMLRNPDSFFSGPVAQSNLQGVLQGLSVNGNPFGNPTSLALAQQGQRGLYNSTLANLGQLGGLSGYNSAGASGAINNPLALQTVLSQNNGWNAIGAGLNSFLNPQPSMAELLATLRSGNGGLA